MTHKPWAIWYGASVSLILQGGCRSVPKETCFRAHGREVWVERHVAAHGPSEGVSTLEVRLVPDSASDRAAADQQVAAFVMSAATPRDVLVRRDGTPRSPAVFKLKHGSYVLALHAITYEPLSREVDLGANDSVIVEAQLRQGDYCQTIVTTGY